jgi:hypothetical protein
MSNIPEFPSGLKPFTAEELEQEEQRQRLEAARAEAYRIRQQQRDRIDARNQKVKRRPMRFARIEASYRERHDDLILFGMIVDLLAATVPDITQRFLAAVECGDFPIIGTGFRREPDRRAVNALIDFHSLNAVWPFVAGQYPLHPSLSTIKAAPLEMRARRSVWAQWIREQGWPVPAALSCGLVICHEPAPGDNPPGDQQAPANQQQIRARRGNTSFDDSDVVATAHRLQPALNKRSKLNTAKAAIEKHLKENPPERPLTDNEKNTWINRIRRKI